MLPAIISVNKTLEKRRCEFDVFFSSQERCNTMCRFWADDIDLAIGDRVKWQALWQLSEESCAHFEVLYPTAVVVRVEEIKCEELSAIVTVEGVQDDISFPDQAYVPLYELFPTKDQPNISFAVAVNLADWLDRCRFFFLHLWYPWDNCDKTLICEWAEQHLDNRLKLQYDILSGTMEQVTSDHIQTLMKEAIHVADGIENNDHKHSNEHKFNLMKNIIRKGEIEQLLNFYEDPDLRAVMVAYTHDVKKMSNSTTWLVGNGGTLTDHALWMERAKDSVELNRQIQFSDDPQHTFEVVKSGSLILLAPGIYVLSSLRNLAYGGKIKGLGLEPKDTIITPAVSNPRMFMFLKSFGSFLFENITIERNEGVIICSMEGTLRLESCHLRGEPGSLVRGVIVQSGCRLEMINCTISNLSTAILAKSDSSVSLESTTISNCSEGIKVLDGAVLELTHVVLESCSEAGIVLQTMKQRQNVSGGVGILAGVEDITLTNSKFEGNKVDVLIDLICEN